MSRLNWANNRTVSSLLAMRIIWMHYARTTLKTHQRAYIFVALGLPVKSDVISWSWLSCALVTHFCVWRKGVYSVLLNGKYKKTQQKEGRMRRKELKTTSFTTERLALYSYRHLLHDYYLKFCKLWCTNTRAHHCHSSGYSLFAKANGKDLFRSHSRCPFTANIFSVP